MKIKALQPMIRFLLPAALSCLASARTLPVQEPPAEARRHYASAKELVKKGERIKAIAELREAIRLAPEFIEAHQDYITHQTIDPIDLVGEYEKRAKERGGSAVFHYLLGRAYAKAGRNREAVTQHRKSLEFHPGYSWALLELGVALKLK